MFFVGQYQDWGDCEVEDGLILCYMCINMVESLFIVLVCCCDKDGKLFLSCELVLVGECFCEDFELVNMGL